MTDNDPGMGFAQWAGQQIQEQVRNIVADLDEGEALPDLALDLPKMAAEFASQDRWERGVLTSQRVVIAQTGYGTADGFLAAVKRDSGGHPISVTVKLETFDA
jgi:hypothetical protein